MLPRRVSREAAIAGALFLLAAVFRLYRLTDIPCGIWIDEGRMAFRAMVAWEQGWRHIFDWRPVSVPGSDEASHLYLVCFDTIRRIFGGGLLGIRMASVLPGILTAIPFWRVARQLLPRSGAIFATVAFATGIWSANHARWTWEQTLLILLQVGASASLLSWWRTGARRHLFAIGAQCGVAMATYTTWPATLAAFVAATALTPWVRGPGAPNDTRPMAPAFGWALLAMTIAAAPFMWHYRSDPSPLLASYHELSAAPAEREGAWTIGASARAHAAMFVSAKGGSDQDGPTDLPVVDPITAIAFFAGLVALLTRPRSPSSAILLPWLLFIWLTGPLSTAVSPPPYIRRIGAMAPAIYLVSGAGWALLGTAWRALIRARWSDRVWTALSATAIAAMFAWNGWALFAQWGGRDQPVARFGVSERLVGEDLRTLRPTERALVLTNILSGAAAGFTTETSAQTIRTIAGERIPLWGINPEGTPILIVDGSEPPGTGVSRVYGKPGDPETERVLAACSEGVDGPRGANSREISPGVACWVLSMPSTREGGISKGPERNKRVRSRPDLGQIRPIRLSATGGVVAAYGEDCTIEASVEDGPKMGCEMARLFLSGPRGVFRRAPAS